MELTEPEDVKPCPPKHTVYLSQMLATNAATLHTFQNPHCASITTFPCGDHFHIGHSSPAGKDACLGKTSDNPSQ